MTDVIIVSVVSLIGTLAGTYGGIMTANKLSNYRIQKLEEEVKKYNNVKDRTTKNEVEIVEIKDDIKEIKQSLKEKTA